MISISTNQLDEKTWREFVNHEPSGNIFHTPEMFEVFKQTKGHFPEIWAAENDHSLVALLPIVRVTLSSGILAQLTTRAIAYGGMLCSPDAQDALRQVISSYTEETGKRQIFTELRNLSDMSEVQPALKQGGFIFQEHVNYLIDVDRPIDEIFQSIGKRTRKNIRHGLNQGKVTIEEIKKQADIAECYTLISKTYKAAKVTLADRSLFESAFKVLHPKGMIRISMARVDGIPAAVSVELIYKNVVYGWYSGLDRTFSAYSPNELLMWDILKWSAENDFRIYDFGGAGNPNEKYSVRDFKAKFGGKLVSYGRNMCIHRPTAYWLSKTGYQVWRHLPAGRLTFN